MDLNLEYANHQRALMSAKAAGCSDEQVVHLEQARGIADRITAFQLRLGAAAACAWSVGQFATIARV